MPDSGRTTSVWMATSATPAEPKLTKSLSADVCVIGAGIAGMTSAYLLTVAGKKVVVLDDGAIGGGETSRTTAHLSSAFDDRYFNAEVMHGADGARLIAESHSAAIDRIEAIVTAEAIDCDFRRLDGYLFLAPEHSRDLLEKELAAAHRASLVDVELLPRVPDLSFDSGPCLRFPRQATFHPLRYLTGLATAIELRGGLIFTGAHVEDIQGKSPVTVKVGRHSVTATAVVVATNAPISDYVVTHAKQAPYRSYVIGARIPKGSVPDVLLWDTGDPYHYVRIHGADDADVLIVGGEDHKTGQKDDHSDRFERLLSWTRERFPMVSQSSFAWSGQVLEPADYVAMIGKNPGDALPNAYVATGDSGQGMTHGTIAGILLTDLITGRPNPWTALYDPSRITLRSAPDVMKENLNSALQYADFLKPGDVASVREIMAGEGAVLRHGLHLVATYRDRDGDVHERSAVCPHLKCIVHWNAMEKSWDCPCHGSRFDPYGEVLNGPAAAPLAKLQSS